MYRTFNCGIGMCVVVSAADAGTAVAALREAGETVFELGAIRAKGDGEAPTLVV
jgi:phosphoribosylformylglycinamidine cyclo-ligase